VFISIAIIITVIVIFSRTKNSGLKMKMGNIPYPLRITSTSCNNSASTVKSIQNQINTMQTTVKTMNPIPTSNVLSNFNTGIQNVQNLINSYSTIACSSYCPYGTSYNSSTNMCAINIGLIQISGNMKQVSINNGIVVGVNSAGDIYYADTNINSTPNWTQLSGALTCVSVSNRQLYGVNSSGAIYYNASYKTSNWVQVSGPLLVQVDFNGSVVVGVNSVGDIYYADTNINSAPNWTQLSGALTCVSVGNGQLYGVNSSGTIYYNASYKTSNWVQVSGPILVKVNFDGSEACGVDSSGNIYYSTGNVKTNPNWIQIQGTLANVSISNGQLYGVNSAGNIFYGFL